jgi:hypothetical protein
MPDRKAMPNRRQMPDRTQMPSSAANPLRAVEVEEEEAVVVEFWNRLQPRQPRSWLPPCRHADGIPENECGSAPV